jgi:hypothetical protein
MSLNIFPEEGGVISNATTMLNENFDSVLNLLFSPKKTERLVFYTDQTTSVDWGETVTINVASSDLEFGLIEIHISAMGDKGSTEQVRADVKIEIDSVNVAETNGSDRVETHVLYRGKINSSENHTVEISFRKSDASNMRFRYSYNIFLY